MTIQQFLIGQLEWFIPEDAKKEAGKRIKAQLVTAMLFMVIPFHIGPIIKFMALNSPVAYVNFAHMLTCLILLVFMKATGRTTLIGVILIVTLFLQEATSVYFTGGILSNVVGLILVVPVGGILLVGYRTGLFLVSMLIAFLGGLYYLRTIGHPFPRYDIGETAFVTEKYYYVVAVFFAYTLIAAFFQLIKENTLRSQRNIEEHSKDLAVNIQQTINQIGIDSTALASSAEELSKTSVEMQNNADQISISETQSAASTNQSASTIQELSASLREITKRMLELRKFADTAEEEGEFASDIVSESDEMMTSIETSSQQIEKITKIITDIAEQTNLLSLNAAIEADKAGDFGMGFAVVAEEVGELAVRSNKAAEQISDLISRSDVNVKDGKTVVGQTGEILEQMVSQVKLIATEVNDLVTSITEQDTSTREVARGAEEISARSDKNLELITSLVELIGESNATISDLSRIADQLDDQAVLHKS
jgi:methyl-accepting chemotaxis protein